METVFWKRLTELCAARKSTPTEQVKAAGLAAGNVTYWRRGRIPNTKMMERLEEYFGVEEGYFTAEGQKEKQPPEYEGLSETAKKIAELADRLPPEYQLVAQGLIESLARAIPNPASDEQSQ